MSTPVSAIEARLPSRILNFFAKDELTATQEAVIREHVANGLLEAQYIQSVGMAEPVPLLKMYQSTRLKSGPEPNVALMIESARNAVVSAGPGQGKTTLLKHQLLARIDDAKYIPLLFTLRTHGVLEWLCDLIDILDARRRFHRVPHCADSLLLLVDGYDEVTDEQRRIVSRRLARFASLNAGFFILTCRTGYSATDVAACVYEVAEFDRTDAIAFVDAFAQAMRISLSGATLISELEERKLAYILSHPLMLTLACVIKTRWRPDLPHNAVELMRQAVETLAYRWDEGKGVARASRLGLYSIQMLDCITRLAYEMKALKVRTSEVIEIIGRYLSLIRRPEILPGRVLDEIRAFYGLLFATPDGYCQFVHKTVQDYLAARYKVEKGLFQPARVQVWDLHAAYCACLSHDATQSLCIALRNSRSTDTIRECLINNAFFDPQVVSSAVFDHFDTFRDNFTLVKSGTPATYNISSRSDFMGLADEVFLAAVMARGQTARLITATSAVLGLCASEYVLRRLPFSEADVHLLQQVFGSTNVTLQVWRAGKEHRFDLVEALTATHA